VDLNKTQTLQEISLLLITCSVDEWIWLLTPMTEVCLSIILYESVKNATEQNYPAFLYLMEEAAEKDYGEDLSVEEGSSRIFKFESMVHNKN